MKQLIVVLAAVVWLAGCAGTKTAEDQSTLGAGEGAISSGTDGVYSGGGYNPGDASGFNEATGGDFYDNPNYGQNVVGGPNAPAKDRVIYFGFDSASIDSRADAIVNAHAQYLVNNPSASILLEGHTDSRGSRGYNIALGESRAISVLRRLTDMGVSPNQVRIISYGEEKPAVNGFDEEAYKRNRRAVIQY
ncbi:OmpA family protein [Ostreibacterium oceani]|uniref:Peptidoglycan-associated lipoprotein n=1 Tax=Ostreibacterium oceani TaxID=2654998 RepID=A0A6N7EXM7_9GAMM|nr:OmpA family protein [Ostreibacterium oceani]MPV86139.1 OmpA family protein [Ostreibacterium oceani]